MREGSVVTMDAVFFLILFAFPPGFAPSSLGTSEINLSL